MDHIIEANDLRISYKEGEPIIKNGTFGIKPKDFVFISGASGSGKSTLLKSLYGALRIDGGELNVCGIDMGKINNKRRTILRRHIGIVFQDYKLIKEWNIERNVMLPMEINGFGRESCKSRCENLLSHIRLSHKATKYPLELSGGEQQRVAMARALSHNPVLLLADEPTGNLDDYSSDLIWSLLKGANEQLGMTVVVVTHRIPEALGVDFRHIVIEEGEVYELS